MAHEFHDLNMDFVCCLRKVSSLFDNSFKQFSPADTQLDLEVGFKLFFFTDSCWLDVAIEESD